MASIAEWNWSGDEIVFDHIVPAHRKIPNTNRDYRIDIRAFLTSTKNEVIHRAIDEAMRGLSSARERELFFLRTKGAFDHRVVVLAEYVGRKIAYQSKGNRHPDAWQFPEETLAVQTGDCEDLAFLLASLLLASGISGYMLRVAFGQLVERRPDGTRGTTRDHAWVMYLDEQGHWLLLDPLLYFKQSAQVTAPQSNLVNEETRYEYAPQFLFNDDHLWAMRRSNVDATLHDFLGKRRFFREFDPGFGVAVHSHIFDTALTDMSWFKRQYVKAVSLSVDANIATYDPRDHFDNGYIDEGFAVIEQRLHGKSLGDFALAAHAIGDFYAHSTYELFGQVTGDQLRIHDPMHPQFMTEPDYGPNSPCPLAAARFTVNTGTYQGSREDASNHWHGKIISGRYAQNRDPFQGSVERLTYIPMALRERADYPARAMLPRHDEIAVDGPAKSPSHQLYLDADAYARAFTRRQSAAIEHVKSLYCRWSR